MEAAAGRAAARCETLGVLIVDERRGSTVAGAVTPAAFLSDAIGRRVLREGERRAIVRRIAATRDDVRIAPHVRTSASFAARVVDALDRADVSAALEPLAQHVRTLTAFAGAIDVRSALRDAVVAAPALDTKLRIDEALLRNADDAFAWRRLAAESGATLEPVELGEPQRPLDLAAVDGVIALLRYAGSQQDADARRAIVAPNSGVRADDARALLAAAGDHSSILEVIGRGGPAGATRFAHGLQTLTAAYKAPHASAETVLAALSGSFPPGDRATREMLARIATDFDAARAFVEPWDADDLVAEIEAECAGAPRRSILLDGIEPALPVEDEAPVPVSLRKLSFSASSLNAYAECRRKWWFRYACAAVEDRGSSASFYGIAFHAALEEFHGRHVRFEDADRGTLESFLDYCVVTAFDRHRTRFDAPVEFELQKRRARRTAKKYLTWLLERARRAPFEVIGCETAAEVEIGGHRFIGYIDRLDRDLRTGTITVVDYKTGAIATSAQEYLDDVRAFREFQLPFYYWARTAAGDVVNRLSLVPLKDALLDVAPVELEVVRTSRAETPVRGTVGSIHVDELVGARAQMIALADRLADGTLTSFPATDDPEACRYCAYAGACRERPLALEERFSR